MYELVVDHREHALIERLNARGVQFVTESLHLGDIAFREHTTYPEILVIERKTVDDLKASICDGRAREQKARLMNSGLDTQRIMYLIEGNMDYDLTHKISGLPVSTLIGSIINTQLRDGISVYKTAHINETVSYICRLAEKMEKEGDIFFKKIATTMTDSEYSSVLKKKKKANMTPKVWFISQLSLVPQVTEKVASVITDAYPTPIQLINAYNACNDVNSGEKMLADLTYTIANNKTRRIGKVMSKRIYDFMHGII